MVSIKFNMANPYQNTILLEQSFEEIKEICKKFQMIQDHQILNLKLF